MSNGKLNERRKVERKVDMRDRKLGLGGKCVQLWVCLFSFQNWNFHTGTYWIKINIQLSTEWAPCPQTGHSSLLCMYLCASNQGRVFRQDTALIGFFPYPPGSSSSSPPFLEIHNNQISMILGLVNISFLIFEIWSFTVSEMLFLSVP